MITQLDYPLLRQFVCDLFNGSIFAMRKDHVDLTPEQVDFSWYDLDTTDLCLGEQLLEQKPNLRELDNENREIDPEFDRIECVIADTHGLI